MWLCIFHFPLCTSKGIKDPFENKNNVPRLKKLGHPVFFFFLFFSLLLSFFRLIPWNIEAPCVHLSAWVSKTWTGRRSVSSLPWETGKAPVASVNRANFLSQSFIGFLCKPRNISLFLSSIFLSATFFLYLSLNLFTDAISSEGTLGSCGGWTPAEKEMATLSRIFAWEIPLTGEPGGL